jgi:hypothetical protein
VGDDAQARIVVALGEDRLGVVGGAVVDDDDLEVAEALRKTGVYAAAYDPSPVIGSDHDAESGI